jgi:hypothetical protein
MTYPEAYSSYTAQVILQIDEEIAEKGHFCMETSSLTDSSK